MIFWLLFGVAAIFAAVALFGAPYVPTHRVSVERALDLLKLKKGDLIVDFGSGDGVLLKAAAKRGVKSIGYEINPILVVITLLRCWRDRHMIQVRLADFWRANLPAGSKAVFVFLAGPYMKRLAIKLKEVMDDRQTPLYVISYGFEIPGLKQEKFEQGLHLYKLVPAKR